MVTTPNPTLKQASPLVACSVGLSPKNSIQELLAPLQKLDQRLKQTLEVIQILKGTAFEGYLLGSTDIRQSLITAIAPSSPLANLQQAFQLSDFDVEVLVLAIAPELDRRYERLYAQLQIDACRKPTVQLTLDLLCHSLAEKSIQRDRLATEAPLVRHGLIQTKANTYIDNNRTFTLNPVISRYLLGLPMTPQLSVDCQLSWPKEIGYVTNSPLLLGLLSRLKAGCAPQPLQMKFTGVGNMAQGSGAIAATVQQPLLTVNLERLLHPSGAKEPPLTKAEATHKAQQILLQARLWNAVLYFDTAEKARSVTSTHSWLASTLTQKSFPWESPGHRAFFQQIATYPGITIFTGNVPSLPSSNFHKGIITIPFTPPQADSASYWQTCLATAQATLTETEWFRQKLIGASFGFG